MEQTNVNACKFILMTYEGNGNHYYDTTFNLRAPFRPNSNGQYQVQFNEIMFKNNEASLEKDKDVMKFTINALDSDDATVKNINFEIKPTKDIYTYKLTDIAEVFESITGAATNTDVTDIDIVDADGNVLEVENVTDASELAKFIGVSFGIKLTLRNTLTLRTGKLTYTDNYAYILNNMNQNVDGVVYNHTKDPNVADDEDLHTVTYWFMNIRLNGPYIYVLDTPLTSVVNTLNPNNEAYNIVALSYNSADHHNSTIQMCTAMECTTNDLSNLRVRLLNDQYDVVKVREPVYLQITVSNQG